MSSGDAVYQLSHELRGYQLSHELRRYQLSHELRGCSIYRITAQETILLVSLNRLLTAVQTAAIWPANHATSSALITTSFPSQERRYLKTSKSWFRDKYVQRYGFRHADKYRVSAQCRSKGTKRFIRELNQHFIHQRRLTGDQGEKGMLIFLFVLNVEEKSFRRRNIRAGLERGRRRIGEGIERD